MVQFYIGKTKPEYVIAEFDDTYTTVTISKNGEDSDGITKDFVNPTADPDYPIYNHRATLRTVIVQEGITRLGNNAFGNTLITSISIPSTVKELGSGCFTSTKITTVSLPDGLEYLGNGAFRTCRELVTVDPLLPSALTYLGFQAFNGCSKLTGSILVPEGVSTIQRLAFNNCSSLNGTLQIAEGVTAIESAAFSGCSKLTGDLTLPSTLKTIQDTAFQQCGFNGELNLNEGLEHIGDWAFNQCSQFTNITLTIPSTVVTLGGDTILNRDTLLTSPSTENIGVGTHIFYNFATTHISSYIVADGSNNFKSVEGVLFTKDMSRLIAYPASKEGYDYEIPEGVTKIDEMSFSRTIQGSSSNKLKKLILPDSYDIITELDDLPVNFANFESGNTLSAALYRYSTVESVEVKASNSKYSTVNGCLYDKNLSTLYYIPIGKSGQLRLNGLTNTIAHGALMGFNKQYDEIFSNLTELTIPRYLTNVDDDGITMLNNFLSVGNSIIIEPGNTVLAVRDNTVVKLNPIFMDGLISNVKLISSGQVPTTNTLHRGEMAFGKVGDNYEIYINSDNTIQKVTVSVSNLLSLTGGELSGPIKITRAVSSDLPNEQNAKYFEAVFDEDNNTTIYSGYGRPFAFYTIKDGVKTEKFSVDEYGVIRGTDARLQTATLSSDITADTSDTAAVNKKYVDNKVSTAVDNISLRTLDSIPVSTDMENMEIVPTEGENNLLYFCTADKKLYTCTKTLLGEMGNQKIYTYVWSVMLQPSAI